MFLRSGGVAQQRYEDLRRRWTAAAESLGALGLVRLPWGQRLVHFGLLGLLDEDPTAAGWFGAEAPVDAESSLRCVRVLLGAEDADLRVRDIYRRLLGTADLDPAVQEGC